MALYIGAHGKRIRPAWGDYPEGFDKPEGSLKMVDDQEYSDALKINFPRRKRRGIRTRSRKFVKKTKSVHNL